MRPNKSSPLSSCEESDGAHGLTYPSPQNDAAGSTIETGHVDQNWRIWDSNPSLSDSRSSNLNLDPKDVWEAHVPRSRGVQRRGRGVGRAEGCPAPSGTPTTRPLAPHVGSASGPAAEMRLWSLRLPQVHHTAKLLRPPDNKATWPRGGLTHPGA